MAFKDNIKTLKKEYYNILKKYYNTSNLILKMVALHNKSALSEVDLNFRTCEVYYFTDKNINKLLDKDIAKAIQNLRSRAICCIYTAR